MTDNKYLAAQSACTSLFTCSIVVPMMITLTAGIVTGLTLLPLSAVTLLLAYDVSQYKNHKTYTFSPLQHAGIATAALLLTIATPALSSFILPVMTLLAVVGYMMAEKHLNQTWTEKCTNNLHNSVMTKRDWSQDLKSEVESTFGISLSPN